MIEPFPNHPVLCEVISFNHQNITLKDQYQQVEVSLDVWYKMNPRMLTPREYDKCLTLLSGVNN